MRPARIIAPARTTDLANDEADRKAGKKITVPMCALWGTAGIPDANGPLAIWKEWATDVTGSAIDSGHFVCRGKSGRDGEGDAANSCDTWHRHPAPGKARRDSGDHRHADR